MRAKNPERQEAVRLRWEGLSYLQIAHRLNVSTGSLSRWLRTIPVTVNHRPVMPSEIFRTRGARLHADRLARTAVVVEQARREIGSLSARELKIAGAMLYWAEGSKSAEEEMVVIANSDPQLVGLALRWLRSICGAADQGTVQIRVHGRQLYRKIQGWIQGLSGALSSAPVAQAG